MFVLFQNSFKGVLIVVIIIGGHCYTEMVYMHSGFWKYSMFLNCLKHCNIQPCHGVKHFFVNCFFRIRKCSFTVVCEGGTMRNVFLRSQFLSCDCSVKVAFQMFRTQIFAVITNCLLKLNKWFIGSLNPTQMKQSDCYYYSTVFFFPFVYSILYHLGMKSRQKWFY